MTKRNRSEADADIEYRRALKDKKLPLLTLDPRWHELFPDHAKTSEIKNLEKKLNKLIKNQGKANTDIKAYEQAKKKLMLNIVQNMDDGSAPDSEAKHVKKDKSGKLIREINQKIVEAEEALKVLPAEIQEANQELLVVCMRVCYERLINNTREIEHLADWILEAREELKDRLLLKQDLEIKNTAMYSYMHDLLGAEVMEIFDKDKEIWKGETP